MNVTFFNEFGEAFLYERARAISAPEIIVITSAKVSQFKGQLYLTNFPATRFYFKPKHPSVENLKKRQVDICFYVLPEEVEEEEEVLQTVKINELKKLTETHIEAGDDQKFPAILKFPQKKLYNFTIMLTKENVKEGSNVYKAVQISEPMDISGDHSPLKATTNNQVATEIIDTRSKVDTPLTGNSSNKTKPRFTVNLDKSEAMDLSGNVTPVKSSREHEVPTEITDTNVKETQPKVDTPLSTYSACKTRPRLNVNLDKSEEPTVKQPRVRNIKKEKEKLNDFNNRHGKPQKNIKFKLFDGNSWKLWKKLQKSLLYSLLQVQELPASMDEVVCKAILKCLQEYTSWKYFVCTSCYTKVETDNNGYTCGACKREVVEPNQKFAIHVIASDQTGELDLMLDDRAVRTLLEEINLSTTTEDDGIAEMLQMLNGKGYTVKVSISQANVEKKDKVFLATDLFSGFDYEENKGGQRQLQENSESFTAQPSTSSYHLDDISQLNYNAT
ncbi:hypothetical protein DCAR_0102671 [Daucus carota subsp. sativus]|uniref:Uncharacterized protein n=1 Tax=Daucus carota subsp. sativus TaxID=79200 RepID=A0A169WUN3_DAUCS|nr:hypothetical protein DCAR_0102671 [Daucus carota subsp. sativus]